MIQLKDAHCGAKQQSFTHYILCCDNYWCLFIYDSIYYDNLIYNHMIYITYIKLLIIIDYNSSIGLYFYLRFKCGAKMYIVGSSPCQVKPKTLKLALTASPLSTQYYAESG